MESAVRYVSTRGRATALGFDDVLLTGLAADGGLYVPESWPQLSAAEITALAGLPYPALAAKVAAPFVKGSILANAIVYTLLQRTSMAVRFVEK